VFLDDFGELRQIPLDRYGDRLEPFDPRNDGYAERLRSVFVRDGKRFFFIPRKRNLEKNLTAALEAVQPGLVWSLNDRDRKQPGRQPLAFNLTLFVAAAITGLFFMRPRRLWLVLFPVLGGLCLRGAPGFALAAILGLLPDLLGEPVRELVFARWKRFSLYSFRWGLFTLLLVLYGIVALAGQVPPVLAALTFLVFTLTFFFSSITGDHRPFAPVPILRMPVKRLNASKVMLPFALASCLAFLFAGFSGGFEVFKEDAPPADLPPLISAADYRAHAEYQRRFSFVPLGQNGFDEVSYFHYNIGEDGLIVRAGLFEEGAPEADLSAIPPFPLEALMYHTTKVDGMRSMGFFKLLPVLLVLLLCVPVLSGGRQGKKKRPAIYNDRSKRIAA
jgi:hypothetical protein